MNNFGLSRSSIYFIVDMNIWNSLFNCPSSRKINYLVSFYLSNKVIKTHKFFLFFFKNNLLLPSWQEDKRAETYFNNKEL